MNHSIRAYIAKKISNRKKVTYITSLDILRVKIDQITELNDRDLVERTPPQHVSKIELHIKNLTKSTQSVSYLDFIVRDMNGRDLDFYRYAADSLGDVIAPNRRIHGTLNVISKVEDIREIHLLYHGMIISSIFLFSHQSETIKEKP